MDPVPALKRHRVGTHRVVPPEVTLERVLPIVRRLGITRVANITGLDVVGIPVVAVMRPNSRSLAVAQGKGVDLVSAKVSGLMESIENYHAENIQKPLLLDSEATLRARGASLIDIAGLARVAGGCYDPAAKILWIEGHEVFSRKPLLLPFEVVHADYVLPLPQSSGAFLLSDSGVASGNHPLEATSHAICELVERDALTLWSHRPQSERRSTRVELTTVDDASCRWAIERFEQAGLAVGVWDVTSDVGIPSFFCRIVDREPNPFRPLGPMAGSGCHPCREVALFRALSEAAQSRLTVISGSRDDLGLAVYERGRNTEEVQSALRAMNEPGARPWSASSTFEGASVEEDLAWELAQLGGAGLQEVVVVDLALPDVGLAVVRVVIPGLEGIHDATGYSPGARLRRLLS